MTDYPENKRAQSGNKRSGTGTLNRPLSGVGAHSSIDKSSISDNKSSGAGQVANVKNFKGPNFPFPSIDKLMTETKPEEWNNIPLPVVDTIKRIMSVCIDLKKQTFENFNEIVSNAHTANMIQPACRREVADSR